MHAIAWIASAVLWGFVASPGKLFAAGDDALEKYLATAGPMKMEWNVSQDFYPEKATIEKSIAKLKNDISKLKEGTREREEITNILNSTIASATTGTHSDVVFILSYVSPKKYICEQGFLGRDKNLEVDYFAAGDGSRAMVEVERRTVQIDDESAEDTLGRIMKGDPALALRELSPSPKPVKVSENDNVLQVTFESTDRDRVDVYLNKPALTPGYIKVTGTWSAAGRTDPAGITSELTASKETFGNSNLPKTVTYYEYAAGTHQVTLKQVWTLTDVSPLPDPLKFDTTYKFVPGYRVSYFTKEKTGEFKSDDLLK
ncbi:MAG: hypothetical protein WCD79_14195 [Chthoniobacteraceae bacterium]